MSLNNISSSPKTPVQPELAVQEFRNFWMASSVRLNEFGIEYVNQSLNILLEEYLWTHIRSLSKDSPEFKNAVEKIFEKISTSEKFDKNEAQDATIKSGILIVTKKDGTNISFNLVDLWKEVFMEPQKIATQQKAREEERKLQDIVAKEAFYGGNVIMEYSLGGATVAAGVISLAKIGHDTVKVGSDAAKVTHYVAKSMIVVDEDGAKKRIHFKKPFSGTSADFNDSMSRILSLVGLDYDPKTKRVFSPAKRMLQALGKDLENLKYEDFKKTPEWSRMTEKQFEEFKQKALRRQNSLLRWMVNGSITSKQVATFTRSVVKESLMFFPFVATEYHNSQSAHNLLNAVTNEAAFYVGAKIGSRAGTGIYKVAWLVAGWVWWVFLGQLGLEQLDARRHVWLNTQKMNYRHERSAGLHGTSLFLTEITAWVNWLGRKITGNKNYTGMDIGSDKTHVIVPGLNKHLFTVPEFTLYQDKVNMWTKPWEWINGSVARDVTDWNRYVDRYKIEATKNIYEILGKYHQNKWIFSDNKEVEKAGGKDELLKKELLELLIGDNSGTVFENEITNLINGIIFESSRDNPIQIPNSVINEFIETNIGAMKIDSGLFVLDRERRMQGVRIEIDSLIETIPNLTAEHKNFLQKIPDRMLANEELCQNNSEKLIYEYLLKRTDIIDFEWEKLSVWNFMAFWLDKVVDWKHETYFIQRMQSGSDGTPTWTSF